MSLVITVWDSSAGVAVCEGRALGYVNGAYVPVDEDYSKLVRLPNGNILGFAGRVRDGYPLADSPLSGVIAGHLLPAISQAARGVDFRGLCAVIPTLLKEYAVKWPGLLLFVSLLGTDDGIVRGGAWDSDGSAVVPTTAAVTWQILGPAELSGKAHTLVRASLGIIGGLKNPALAGESLQNIIQVLAASSDKINGNTRLEYLHADTPVTALTADMIRTGTLDASAVSVVNINASNINTGTLAASAVQFPDGTTLNNTIVDELVDQTVNHITAKSVNMPASAVTVPAHSINVPVATITVDVAGTLDIVRLIIALGSSDSSHVAFTASFSWIGQGNLRFALLTGLSAGSHTFYIYGSNVTSTDDTVEAQCGAAIQIEHVSGPTGGFVSAPRSGGGSWSTLAVPAIT